jgi:sugar/nucleoside kinase (ribokinase family)
MIKDEGEREECFGSINKNLTLSLKEIDKFDGILINMVSGFDISLEQLINIRQNYNGPIYFDVHTFSRGVAEDMKRNFRTIPEFNRWAENLDIIQVNKNELKTISMKEKNEEIIEEVLNFGVKYLIVTLEGDGAKLFTLEKNNIISYSEPAIKIDVKNKIGCGDVFGSMFFYNYIKFKDVNKALKLANIAAGCTASYSELSEFRNLKNDVFSRYN